jgi:regulator of nucleoside diphosphate kinase
MIDMEFVSVEAETLIISDTDYVRLSQLNNNQLLRYEFARAVVVPADQVPKNVVAMHSCVVYLDESTGISREVKLVYPTEVDLGCGKISVLSPLGAALLGLKQGQTIDWPIPSDPDKRLKIMRVEKASYWEGFIMNKAIANTKLFVSTYIVLMLLTYYLPSLGSKTFAVQSFDVIGVSSAPISLLPLSLHILAMLGLLWINWVRGVMIDEKWLVLLPIVAFAFDFIPKLSAIPVVPSIYHLLAIVVGVACPFVAAVDQPR